jgi:hypothetical protein
LRVLDRRWHVGLVERADVGAGRDDLVDPVEDLVGQGDVDAGQEVVELFERLYEQYLKERETKAGS